MSRINSGLKALNQLVGSRVITPSGADWAVVAADPYHDLELPNLAGYPDVQDGSSVTLRIPVQMEISAPEGTTEPWSFLATYYPWTCADQGSGPVVADYDCYGNYLKLKTTQPNAVSRLPPVSVYRGKVQSDLGPFELATPGNAAPIGLGVNDTFCKGSHRQIAGGIEIYDTTAVIDRQGTCTVWRQNTNTYNKASYTYKNAPKNDGNAVGVAFNRPPKNIAEATLLAGTRSWKSEDGCYIVLRQNQEQLLAKQPDDTQPVLFDGDILPGIRSNVPAHVISGSTQDIAVDEDSVSFPSVVWNLQPYHMTGAFFTGLSPKSTFLLRFIVYIERFPTPDEQDIVLLTKPSANHDPIALEIYDRMMRTMPVGCPVADNGLGEWFYEAISAVKDISAMIPHPIAQAVSKGSEMVQYAMAPSYAPKITAKKVPTNQGRGPPRNPKNVKQQKPQPQPQKQKKKQNNKKLQQPA
jgi:hypothetical protein